MDLFLLVSPAQIMERSPLAAMRRVVRGDPGLVGKCDRRSRGNGGFPVVADPAKHGNSGIMTFIVNQDGRARQSDPGPETPARTEAMRGFDPGTNWTLVTAQ